VRSSAVRCFGKVFAQLSLSAALLATTAPADANNQVGAWSTVHAWPLITVHSVLMPDGRVLSYGSTASGQQTAHSIYDVWDPAGGLDGGHTTLPNNTGTDIFCSSQVVVPQGGQVFIAGGDNWTGTGTTNTGNNNSNTFNYNSNTLDHQNNMNRPRWYSSSIALPNGEIYIQGGSGGTDFPEIRGTNGVFRLMTGANTSAYDFMFPRNFIAPDGRVFGFDSNGKMYYVNTSGTGSITAAGQFSGPTGSDASAVMFRPGKILQFGGNTNNTRLIDITSGAPVVTTTLPNLSSRRRLVTATVMADGRVLATGGSDVWNEMTGVNYNAEIWNPTTGQWTVGPPEAQARLYHSTAVLMPDASVLVSGGGAPGPQNNTNMEIYYPPYLYNAAGGFATRPVIDSAPSAIDIGETFGVQLGGTGAISRVALIKTASVSHSWNTEQRFIELTFQQNGDELSIQAPTKAGDAPPGFYLLFVLNSAGTPSMAKIAKIGVAANPNPSVTPSLVNPGNQSGQAGTSVSMQLSATDPNGDSLTYSASGLPSGVSINPSTGEISGTPTAAGTFNVVVTASDGINSDSEGFAWIIGAGPPYVLDTPPAPSPATVGSSVTYQASVTGGVGIQYQWDFDDGTPVTPFSSASTIAHVFATPGIHYVTLTAKDSSGTTQSTVIVQTVHYALTANRPAMSSSIVFEDTPTSADRLWVVNQDSDTVTVFNTKSGLRIRQRPVGVAPRSIALSSTGQVWVTNKQSASISVIDATTREVVRTIALPAGSQPFGIVSSPVGGVMYVALEATGRLLKIDAASYATLASLDVGPNPRQLSVTGDGNRVYVSRFITPPLPGESTALVQTATGGGEVVVVNGPAMSIEDTIVLRHSDKPDAENQGRGVPNYLGAAAIAPDGRSAWVPSKQDNIKRGTLRNNVNLTFQNTVRAISSRIDLQTGAEDYSERIDHDNAGLASAALHDLNGIYLFVALETTRQVAVVDAYDGREIFRFAVGRAPQGLALSADGRRLYVSNFMDRSVGVFDLSTLVDEGIADVPLVATWISSTADKEKLSPQVLLGKQLFYDAQDARLARDGYISCASCHNDGGQDGRVWDLTGFGEGLRNTVSLRGRAGGQGFLHWSANFDEVQDFEGQIRNLASGSGLMSNALFNAGTRSSPLGDPKAGLSADLDALAAYVASLNAFSPSPLRNADGTLTAAAVAGKQVFQAKNCGSCHSGSAFTESANNNPEDIGTINADSGDRLGGPLSGIDVPTLRDVWATAPYLHRGSAATLGDAISAHQGISMSAGELANLVAYVSQIGSQEGAAGSSTPNTGTGLAADYFNNTTLAGSPALERTESVNFSWPASPGAGVNADNFSARWTGFIEASATGNFRFQTRSNAGVRLWINGNLVVDNWTAHATADNVTGDIAMTKNQRYSVTLEMYDTTSSAVAKFFWMRPGQTTFTIAPVTRLYAN
jgi:YVTN family beta-propeller protein